MVGHKKYEMEPAVDLVSSSSSSEESVVVNPNQVYVLHFRGPPRAWKRPKAQVKMNGSGGYYKNVTDPNKDEKERLKNLAKTGLQEKGWNTFPIFERGVPVIMQFEFMRRLPNTYFVNNDRSRPLKASYTSSTNIPDVMVPDLDNLVKLLKDALIGVFYEDDSQVVSYEASKMMDVEPPHEGCSSVWIRRAILSDLPEPRNPIRRDPTHQRNSRRVLGR